MRVVDILELGRRKEGKDNVCQGGYDTYLENQPHLFYMSEPKIETFGKCSSIPAVLST